MKFRCNGCGELLEVQDPICCQADVGLHTPAVDRLYGETQSLIAERNDLLFAYDALRTQLDAIAAQFRQADALSRKDIAGWRRVPEGIWTSLCCVFAKKL